MSFAGTWEVVSSPDFDDDYLSLETEPYITLRQSGSRVEGEFQVGLQRGDLDGRLEEEDLLLFSFEGEDEMEPVSGAGKAVLKGDRLTLTLMYHEGDDYTFECERRKGS